MNILSRTELLGFKGGNADQGSGRCLDGWECWYEESPGNDVAGECQTNSNNRCVCAALWGTSSVIAPFCLAG